MPQEYHKGDVLISTDKSLLQLKIIREALKCSYWADNIPSNILEKAIENSLCFGMYSRQKQIGFARVVTDFSTIAYIADFFILDNHASKELSDWLMECICVYPQLLTLKRWLLASKDGLYAKFHLTPVESSS